MPSRVRVYNDGRLCVPAPVLREAAQKAGKRKLPRKIWIGPTADGDMLLAWDRFSPQVMKIYKTHGFGEPKEYDLSVRERVLFGSYPKGRMFPVYITSGGNILISGAHTKDALLRDRDPTPDPARTAHTLAALAKAKKRGKKHNFKKAKKDMDRQVRLHVAKVLRKEHPDATVAEIAKSLPELTVAELVGQ